MRDIRLKELHLLVGLPGSGKTTYAQREIQKVRPIEDSIYSFGSKHCIENGIVDFDYIHSQVMCRTSQKMSVSVQNAITRDRVREMALPNRVPESRILVLDGLFTTQEDYEWVISLYTEKIVRSYAIDKIVVDYWIPDIEACLWNDLGRREQNSEETIRNLKIEKPNVAQIQEKFGIPTKLIVHSVVKKPKYLVLAGRYGIDKSSIHSDRYLYSCSWSLGGKYYSYTGNVSYMDPETPCNFDEFDNLLSEICPQITFLQYKKLYRSCVTEDSRDSSDYYSESREGFYRCDLEMLFEMLEEMGILSE